jgi:uncharacterized protein YjdB
VNIEDIPEAFYTGTAIEPVVNVTDGSTTLVKGADYTLSYENNVNTGTGIVTIKGIGNYSGEKIGIFTIMPKASVKTTSITISGKKKIVAGSSAKLTVKVLPENTTDKSVTWSSSKTSVATISPSGQLTAKKPGKTVITAKAKDGSGIKKKLTVYVYPKKISVKKAVSSKKKKITVSWKKLTGVTGYQIKYSTNSKFKNSKVKNVSSKKISTTLSAVSNKKYYIKVRAYIKIGSKKYYGGWSNTSKVKVK